MSELWIPLLPFAVFFALFMLSRLLPRRNCPDCHEPLPAIQSPFTKTKRQWVEGGFVCLNCGCEADLSGRKVAGGTTARRGPMVVSAVLLILAAVPAVVLLAALLQH